MRFNTSAEVLAWADKAAREDIRRHVEYNVALNPFCTDGARADWERGFNALGPRTFELTQDFDTIYQRGRAVGRILEAEPGLLDVGPIQAGDRVVTPRGAGGTTQKHDFWPISLWEVKLDDGSFVRYLPHELTKEKPNAS